MANINTLLTYGLKVFSVEQTYFSPIVSITNSTGSISSIYCFLANDYPWDDNNIVVPDGSQKYLKQIQKNIFVAKRINVNDISPVLKRTDWIHNTVYDFYRDDIDMVADDSNKIPLYKFYVKNTYDQVFKCLWNNNGDPSTEEPVFEPGKFLSDNIYYGSDGYKWKYIYSINSAEKVKFMDSTWMPIPATIASASPLNKPAGYGNIDVINVTDVGANYNTDVTITITGDGTGATGTAVKSNGAITDITVTSSGSNYTYANVIITSSTGSNAIAIAPVSPVGGHGSDPISELGCSHVMMTSQFNSSESGLIPIDITYHQLGLLIDPVLYSTGNKANGTIYKTTTDLIVSSGFGDYIQNEMIYQGDTLETSTFSARVLNFDSSNNIVYTINTKGSLILNYPVFGDISRTTRTLTSNSSSDFVALSGYVGYVDNRTSIIRNADGIEQFKVVIGF